LVGKEFKDLFDFSRLEEASPGTPLYVGWGDQSVLVMWCPGNGSKHTVIFSGFSPEIGEAIGCPGPGVLVTLVRNWRSYPVPMHVIKHGGLWHAENYVLEKFDLRGESLYALSAIVNTSLECMCDAYAQECVARVREYR
jgi:hypothetical protein